MNLSTKVSSTRAKVLGLLVLIALAVPVAILSKMVAEHADEAPVSTKAAVTKPATPIVPPKPPTKAELKAQAQERARQAKEQAITDETARVAYAKTMENLFLHDGMSVDVDAFGPKHTRIRLKYVLASKAMSYQITEQRQDILSQMKALGFTAFTLTDGYDESWTWHLAK